MGTVFPRQSDNMKLFAVLALAAVAFAEPEAEGKANPDSALLYGAYGYGLPYAGAYGGYRTYGAYRPYSYGGGYYYGKRSADAEPEGNANAYYPYAYGAYPYAYGAGYGYRTYGAYGAYGYGKRSADAEPKAEADPALLYNTYGYGVPYAGAYGAYNAYSAYRPYSYGGGYYYGKRSAEAEPEADPAVLYSTASIASPLTTAYTAGVAPLTTAYTHAVAAPFAYTHAIAPAATTAVKSVVPTVAQYTVPSVYSGVYGGYPAVYGKRSADAEADPALVYTAGVAPYTAAGVAPYAAYSHVAAPLAYTHAAQYTVPTIATVAKAPAHGVAATYAGLVHSSHVGVCLNNVGVQVPC